MKIYQIYIPDLGLYVKYKLMEAEEVKDLTDKFSELDDKTAKRMVLENAVFNMKTDVRDALRSIDRVTAEKVVNSLYNGCIMLNPGLNIDAWVALSNPEWSPLNDPKLKDAYNDDGVIDEDALKELFNKVKKSRQQKVKPKKITKQKFLDLENYLKSNIIGQNEAVSEVVNAMKRSQVGLNDLNRPLGIFLFAGSSGVGKTHLAATLNKYLYGDEAQMVRIDCGEYQQKHENQKLIGSPPGYVGHDEGGQLVNAVKKNPNTIVLLDEVEKAHQDLWNTFLRVFEDGTLTDGKGEQVNFCNTIIIMTTNLGNEKVVDHLTAGSAGFMRSVETKANTKDMPSRTMVERVTIEAIKKHFRPEFLNRIDKTIIFNHLEKTDYEKIAELEMYVVLDKLSKKGFMTSYTDEVIDGLIEKGVDTVKGARGISKVRRDLIENKLADILLNNVLPKGSLFEIDYKNQDFTLKVVKPRKKAETIA